MSRSKHQGRSHNGQQYASFRKRIKRGIEQATNEALSTLKELRSSAFPPKDPLKAAEEARRLSVPWHVRREARQT